MNSPFSVEVSAAEASAGHSRASGDGLSAGAGVESVFTVDVRDAYGNAANAPAGVLPPSVTVSMGDDVASVANVTAVGGYGNEFFVEYIATVSGEYSVGVFVGGVKVSGSPFESVVVAGAASAGASIAEGEGLTGGSAGTSRVTFSILSHDAYGNMRTSGGDVFEVSISGNGSFAAEVDDLGGGRYKAEYALGSVTGDFHVSVLLSGEHIHGSPFEAVIGPANLSVSAYVAVGEGLQEATAGERASFTVQVKDTFGNDHDASSETLEGTLTCLTCEASNEVKFRESDGPNGLYHMGYEVNVSGEYSMSVMSGGEHVGGSPFRVEVVPGDIAYDRCVVSGDGVDGEIVATDSASFTIQARDRLGTRCWLGVASFLLRVAECLGLSSIR